MVVQDASAVLEAHGRAPSSCDVWLAAAARAMLADQIAKCESPAEEAFLGGLIAIGAVDFCQQVQAGEFRLDFAFEASRLSIEIDGFTYHDRTPELAERDKARDRRLALLGWRVCRFSAREVFRDAIGCARQALELARRSA